MQPPQVYAAACARCATPLGAGDLRCAICGQATPPETSNISVAQATILRCDGCGAALTYDVNVRAPRCGFCGSVAHLEESLDPIEEAQAYLPFMVAPEVAQQSLHKWLGSLGWFRPSNLAESSTVETLTPLWWVGWTFDVNMLVSWTSDSNAGAGRSAWAPHSGQFQMDAAGVLVSASRGLTAKETEQLTTYFDLRSAQPKPHPMPNALIERFDVPRSSARAVIAKAVENLALKNAKQRVPGSSTRKTKVALVPRGLVTRRYAFPTYVLAYRYGGKLYRALVHGQNAQCTFGKAPWSIPKILGVILLILFVIALSAGGVALFNR